MKRLVALVFVVGLAPLPFGTGTSFAATSGIGKQAVKTGLSFPMAFTFAADGRIFYGERMTGEIRILNTQAGTDKLFVDVPSLLTTGERGLLGLALHPNFPTTPYVYAFATRSVNGTARNQILRYTYSNGSGTNQTVIFTSNVAAALYHNGGRILFGPDGNLYAVIGEAKQPALAQDRSKHAGKVLRMTPTGGIPANATSLVYAHGIRNSVGLDFDPANGGLWESENGPECNDEINRISAGGNFAWGPHATCSTPPPAPENTNQDGINRILPKRWFTPTTAPTGLVFCASCGLTGDSGKLFMGEWKTRVIRRVTLTADRNGIASTIKVYTHGAGILSMEAGPNGRLYFSDANGIYRLINTA